MAKVELDPAIKSIRKRMGSLVFRKLPSGETTMIKRADMSKSGARRKSKIANV